MIEFTDSQIESLGREQRFEYCLQILMHLRDCGLPTNSSDDRSALTLISQLVDDAEQIGISETESVVKYCGIGMLVGRTGLQEPVIRDFFLETHVDANFKAKLFFELTLHHLNLPKAKGVK